MAAREKLVRAGSHLPWLAVVMPNNFQERGRPLHRDLVQEFFGAVEITLGQQVGRPGVFFINLGLLAHLRFEEGGPLRGLA